MRLVEKGEPAGYRAHHGNVLDVYEMWPRPDLIVSDGAYGVRGFEGDLAGPEGLPDWYAPHIAAWSRAAKPNTSLWFWNTEIGWASVHPLLAAAGWDYVQTVVWDKGLSHIAGNVNGKTIRQFPVVTEISVLYRRRLTLPSVDGDSLPAKKWIRSEWMRSGLPLYKANVACGVRNAASRKYLTQDWRWYWPPGDMVERMAVYANANGIETSRPYFSIDGVRSVTASEWDALRPVWNHENGVTNVWSRGPLHDSERFKGTMRKAAPRSHRASPMSSAHLNQKPLDFMLRQVSSASSRGDVVWEPFGGLATASVAAIELGRTPCVAEVDDLFFELADERLNAAWKDFGGTSNVDAATA